MSLSQGAGDLKPKLLECSTLTNLLYKCKMLTQMTCRFLCLEFSHVKQAGLKELYDLYSFNVIPKIGGLVANDSASYQVKLLPERSAARYDIIFLPLVILSLPQILPLVFFPVPCGEHQDLP